MNCDACHWLKRLFCVLACPYVEAQLSGGNMAINTATDYGHTAITKHVCVLCGRYVREYPVGVVIGNHRGMAHRRCAKKFKGR